MKTRRGSTWSPISIEKRRSAAAASSTSTPTSLRFGAPEHPVRRIHRRVGELRRVHLAEALEAAERDAFLGEVEHQRAQLLVRLRVPRLLAERDVERRRADDLPQARVGLAQV